MGIRVFKYTDSGAPILGPRTSWNNLMEKIFVTGYGTTAPLGWRSIKSPDNTILALAAPVAKTGYAQDVWIAFSDEKQVLLSGGVKYYGASRGGVFGRIYHGLTEFTLNPNVDERANTPYSLMYVNDSAKIYPLFDNNPRGQQWNAMDSPLNLEQLGYQYRWPEWTLDSDGTNGTAADGSMNGKGFRWMVVHNEEWGMTYVIHDAVNDGTLFGKYSNGSKIFVFGSYPRRYEEDTMNFLHSFGVATWNCGNYFLRSGNMPGFDYGYRWGSTYIPAEGRGDDLIIFPSNMIQDRYFSRAYRMNMALDMTWGKNDSGLLALPNFIQNDLNWIEDPMLLADGGPYRVLRTRLGGWWSCLNPDVWKTGARPYEPLPYSIAGAENRTFICIPSFVSYGIQYLSPSVNYWYNSYGYPVPVALDITGPW